MYVTIVAEVINFNVNLYSCIGEFGVVYRARLIKDQERPQYVAVKTLKGIVEMTMIFFATYSQQ